jgi:hypothetical protein
LVSWEGWGEEQFSISHGLQTCVSGLLQLRGVRIHVKEAGMSCNKTNVAVHICIICYHIAVYGLIYSLSKGKKRRQKIEKIKIYGEEIVKKE